MESYLTTSHYDLVSEDGYIRSMKKVNQHLELVIHIENISPFFRGFSIEPSLVFFNLKSTLAQLGMHSITKEIHLDKKKHFAEVSIELKALSSLASDILLFLEKGAYLGKLFADDETRKVRDPDYLFRMFGRSDRASRPLLSLGGYREKELIVEKIEGRTLAFLALKPGIVKYEPSIKGLLASLAKALKYPEIKTRGLLQLHQTLYPNEPHILPKKDILLLKTEPLHIRTVFARVAEKLLPKGYSHTSASILEPNTMASGDIYEFFGSSDQVIDDIPLEFYTLEPHREHVFFSDRDQLQASLEDPDALFQAFSTAPDPKEYLASVFVVKGDQLHNLTPTDWIIRDPYKHEFPGIDQPQRQIHIVENYIENQPAYPFLKSIVDNNITSQGILLTRFFPTPLLKRFLISGIVQTCLKQIYFEIPSRSHDVFFSHEDRALMLDLAKFAVPLFWVDRSSNKILKFVLKPGKDTGMFVPLNLIEEFKKASAFGVYGSNLLEGNFEEALRELLNGILKIKDKVEHPLLSKDTPIMLVTGGGPGAMEVGNRVAKSLNILSCANIVDFRSKEAAVVNEQKQNPYIDAKMTYHLDRLVERQAEFYLDFPIFLMGGIGMDFEYTLEEVRRKVGVQQPTPVILFGSQDYWSKKITSRFECNRKTGTIAGSEWVSNCFYCIQTTEQGLSVYRRFFDGTLKIGKNGPIYDQGFFSVPNNWQD